MRIHSLLRQGAAIVALGGWLTAVACERRVDTASQRNDSTATPSPPEAGVGSATINGVVRFVGAAPKNSMIDMRAVPLCRGMYHADPRQLSVIVNRNGTLANVFVYVKHAVPPLHLYAAATDPVLLTQRGCQYRPRVFGLMVGQELTLRNDDAMAHQLEARGVATRPFTIPLASGTSREHVFRNPEVMVPLSCGTHDWLRAYVGVLPHPFFATTGHDGRFTIGHLPPGTYTLEAWHEAYGRRTATVTVGDSATQHVTFTYARPGSETSD
jgi:hypothetical protein